jgi:hypothetical protein
MNSSLPSGRIAEYHSAIQQTASLRYKTPGCRQTGSRADFETDND